MKELEQDLLLDHILASEDLEKLRRSTLHCGLAAVRSRRRTRKAVLACVVGFALMTSTVFLFHWPVRSLLVGSRSGQSLADVAVPVAQRGSESFERIGDRELLALFPNQSVALIGAPGDRRLLVFASSDSDSSRLSGRSDSRQ